MGCRRKALRVEKTAPQREFLIKDKNKNPEQYVPGLLL